MSWVRKGWFLVREQPWVRMGTFLVPRPPEIHGCENCPFARAWQAQFVCVFIGALVPTSRSRDLECPWNNPPWPNNGEIA